MDYMAACDYIMTLCRAQTWIKQAPNDPPGAAMQFPFAAVFPGAGSSQRMSDYRRDLHTVHLELHWAFRDLPRQTDTAKDHLDDILHMLWDNPTLNATVDTLTEVTYEFGPMAWGSAETLGYVFNITFKQTTAIT